MPERGEVMERKVRVASLPRRDIDFEALSKDLKPLSNPKRLRLLHYLTKPHYLEEIASELKMARQAAQKHIDQLLEVGVIQKQRGERDSGPVTEYLVVPSRVFAIHDEFGKLGTLTPEREAGGDDVLARTQLNVAAGEMREGLSAEPSLVIAHGMKVGHVFRLTGPSSRFTIGRDPNVEVCIDYDPFVSNRHAEVRREGERYTLTDALSTNGTFVNWRRLDRGATVGLTPGDIVKVGKSLLVFKA